MWFPCVIENFKFSCIHIMFCLTSLLEILTSMFYRHHRVRNDEGLGIKRPLTGWVENGQCKLPDFAWTDWARTQVDRVTDLLGIP